MCDKKARKGKSESFYESIRQLEPLFRLIEVVMVIFGTVFVSVKANKIADKQLAIDIANIQPEFEVIETIEDSIDGEVNANSVLTISNMSGKCNNVNISVLCTITYTYFDELVPIQKEFRLEGYYFAYIHSGRNIGEICRIQQENNWKNYCEFSFNILQDVEDESDFIDLEKYVKITYEDELKEIHTVYFEVNSISSMILEQKEGEDLFAEKSAIEEVLDINNLSLNKLRE